MHRKLNCPESRNHHLNGHQDETSTVVRLKGVLAHHQELKVLLNAPRINTPQVRKC